MKRIFKAIAYIFEEAGRGQTAAYLVRQGRYEEAKRLVLGR